LKNYFYSGFLNAKSTKNKEIILKKIKIFNDPIYGFIYQQSELIFRIIEHPYFQRLRRITQMGLSYLVYPGAHHTRFHHVLGCGYLMQKAIETLRLKGTEISKEEEESLYIAILLHDIGHGPFSHALENSIVKGVTHEDISLLIMKELNREFEGELEMAIQIFSNRYPRKFFYQLISGQLDMDRMDYLKRDSFYSGVAEGNINADRLITMLNVKDDQLVLEEKGIYSVEKFIVARRLMYWQVYLHKTSLAAERILIQILRRASELNKKGVEIQAGKALKYFLTHRINKSNFDQEVLLMFSKLDDYDVISALKLWCHHDDFILSYLSRSIINRKLPKVEMQRKDFSEAYLQEKKDIVMRKYSLDKNDIDYLVFKGKVWNKAYSTTENGIGILMKNGEVVDLVDASDQLNIRALSSPVTKYFMCYPK
jgi:HD superfamily phosphohydrolase